MKCDWCAFEGDGFEPLILSTDWITIECPTCGAWMNYKRIETAIHTWTIPPIPISMLEEPKPF
jgi:hypothetical protein